MRSKFSILFLKVNNQSYYDELLQLTSKYISPLQHDLLRLSLSIRTFSPAIEMSRSVSISHILFFLSSFDFFKRIFRFKLAENSANGVKCSTFVDVHGQVTCDPNEIQTLLDNADIK
jgi:hypothetical protein